MEMSTALLRARATVASSTSIGFRCLSVVVVAAANGGLEIAVSVHGACASANSTAAARGSGNGTLPRSLLHSLLAEICAGATQLRQKMAQIKKDLDTSPNSHNARGPGGGV